MIIYPVPPVESQKDLIMYCTQCEEDNDIVFKCDSSNVEGNRLWTLWTSYLNNERQFSFIRLYLLKKDDKGWGYEQYSYEAEFDDNIRCLPYFLDKSEDSPFIDTKWRQTVRDYNENLIPKSWKDCKKVFKRLRAKNTGEKLRIHFEGMVTKGGMPVEYADVESIYPFIGRFKGKLYELKRPCIKSYEIIPKPKHPLGYIERHSP